MKLQKLFILLILLISIQICFGQKQSEAVLFSETDIINCDVLKAEIDGFFVASLNKTTDYSGYIIIYGERENLLRNYQIEQRLKNFIDYYKFNRNLVTIAQARPQNKPKIQFWIVPKNGSKPEFEEEKSDYILPKTTGQFLFYDDYDYSIGACDTYPFNFDELYFNILEHNKNLRGKIIIKAKSAAEFRDNKTETLKSLTEKYQISKTKLQFSFVKVKDISKTEYWLVPNKTK